MPEGDTVRWAATRLHHALAGKVLRKSDFRVPRYATVDLSGRVTNEVIAYGKHLFHHVDGGVTIHSHLKMEGRWSVIQRDGGSPAATQTMRRKAETAHTTRVLLYTEDALAVGYRLGILEVISGAQEADVIGALGPDLLGTTFPDVPVIDAIRSRDQPLAQVLLDQTVLAGLGTFWVSEMLFNHHVQPWTPARDVSEETLRAVLAEARQRMLLSATTGIQTATGSQVPGEMRRVHARSGMGCVVCNGTVRVAMAGPSGRERTIFYCPACQGGLAPNDDGRPQGVLMERARTQRRY